VGDRDGSPRLPGASATTGRMRKGRRVRSPPAGDEVRLRFQFGPAGRGAGRAILPVAKRGSSPEEQAARRGMVQEGPQTQENVSFGTRPLAEATPELVSQDRRAERLRFFKLANTGRSYARRRWGLAAMPAPISVWGRLVGALGVSSFEPFFRGRSVRVTPTLRPEGLAAMPALSLFGEFSDPVPSSRVNGRLYAGARGRARAVGERAGSGTAHCRYSACL
jgi:hypothetical protein